MELSLAETIIKDYLNMKEFISQSRMEYLEKRAEEKFLKNKEKAEEHQRIKEKEKLILETLKIKKRLGNVVNSYEKKNFFDAHKNKKIIKLMDFKTKDEEESEKIGNKTFILSANQKRVKLFKNLTQPKQIEQVQKNNQLTKRRNYHPSSKVFMKDPKYFLESIKF